MFATLYSEGLLTHGNGKGLGAAQTQHFLVGFLSGRCIHCWKWGTESLCYYCVVVYFSLQITYIGLIYLGAAVLGAYVFTIVVSS